MPGSRDLDELLAGLDPEIDPVAYVYAHVPTGDAIPDVPAIVRVEEAEGTTLVVAADDARRLGLRHEFPCRRIGLRVVSDLEAVGLTATLSTALAAEGIPANVVAGFLHDHLLVPADRVELAGDVLVDLTAPPEVRAATAADESVLWAMLSHAAEVGDAEEPRTDPYLARYVADWTGEGTDVGVVATGASGRVVGAAWCRPLADEDGMGDDVPELAIGTVASCRGRGVGGELLLALVVALAEREVPRLRLDVRRTNPAIRLYERHGFAPVGERTNRVGGSSVVMERAIPSIG